MTDQCDILVVGAGPVGLFLAARLAQLGRDVRLVERESVGCQNSRAIGIHPPGLRCLEALGVADELVSSGVQVRKGLAFTDRHPLGTITFDNLPTPFNYILTVPQHRTEEVLARRLSELAPLALMRGQDLMDLTSTSQRVTARLRDEHGHERSFAASFVVGCDGKHSAVRDSCQIHYRGGPYPAHFIMADVPDDTVYRSAAAVFLTKDGLVESFPLPHERRRWVAGAGPERLAPDADRLAKLVLERTGHKLRVGDATMLSSFTAEHYMASHFMHGRVALAGDSAHVLSPIGGQGMNLGWLDAWALATILVECLQNGANHRPLFARYEKERKAAARAATRRAELFMLMGRSHVLPGPREVLVRTLLRPWLAPSARGLFTMQGL